MFINLLHLNIHIYVYVYKYYSVLYLHIFFISIKYIHIVSVMFCGFLECQNLHKPFDDNIGVILFAAIKFQKKNDKEKKKTLSILLKILNDSFK